MISMIEDQISKVVLFILNKQKRKAPNSEPEEKEGGDVLFRR